jgi:hypothetical protein
MFSWFVVHLARPLTQMLRFAKRATSPTLDACRYGFVGLASLFWYCSVLG